MLLVRGDFNGLFGDLLCLSHGERCKDSRDNDVALSSGMHVTAFDDDSFEGKTEYLVAAGVVEPSPDWLSCKGSRWVLRIDGRGVRHESALPAPSATT